MTTILPRFVAVCRGAAKNELANVLAKCGVSRPFVVTDPFLASSGKAQAVVEQMGVAAAAVYSDTVADPTSDSIDALAAAIKASGADGVVAVGGGSPIDSAKLAVVLAEFGGACRDYKAPVATDATPRTPLIAVPTTAGTGAEATRFAVATDSETGEKMLCAGAAFVPTAAVVDAALADGAPQGLTADTGVDALCHAMEAFVSKRHNAFADGFATVALQEIGRALEPAAADDPAGRDGMAKAAFDAGVAFSASSVTLIHGMSRPLGARCHVAHGRANAVLAPLVTEFSLAGAERRYDHVAACLGVSGGAAALPDHLSSLNDALGVPSLASTLGERGVDERAFEDLVPTMAREALASGSPNNNPVIPSQADIEQLYREIYHAGAAEGRLAAASAA
mmetsp:Transcript_25230/g.77776  ORF Transcript_25230/g.77776 Transcript_25230/m.77776 type:complete len:394 (+) Transcript_25230:226-1407(+)